MGMSQYSDQLQELTHIRSMMEKSTRFVSLNGITGIAIGIIALLAAGLVFVISGSLPFHYEDIYFSFLDGMGGDDVTTARTLYAIAGITLLLAISVGLFFTARKTKKNNVTLWSRTFRLMLLNIAIPLATGGVFCLILIGHGMPTLVAGSMLIFYGLALINGSKYTLQDVNSLGIVEIILGIITLGMNKYGIEMWAIGFGIFHIIYGAKIYVNQQKANG
jgi:hypothetical protein